VPSLSIKQVMSALHAINDKRFNLVVCAKKVLAMTYDQCLYAVPVV